MIASILFLFILSQTSGFSFNDCQANGFHYYCYSPSSSCCGTCSNVYCCKPTDPNQLDPNKCPATHHDTSSNDYYWNTIATVYIVIGLIFLCKAIILIVWLLTRRRRYRQTIIRARLIQRASRQNLSRGYTTTTAVKKYQNDLPSYQEVILKPQLHQVNQTQPPPYEARTISTIS